MLALEALPYIAILWCSLKSIIFYLYWTNLKYNCIETKMSTSKSADKADKAIEASKSSGSAQEKISAAQKPDHAPKTIKKKVPNTPQTYDTATNVTPVVKDSSSKSRNKTKEPTGEQLMSPESNDGSKGPAMLDNEPPPKLKSLTSPLMDGKKKILKKMPKAVADNGTSNIPIKDKQSTEHVGQVNQAKNNSNYLESGTEHHHKSKHLNQVEEHAQDQGPISISPSPKDVNSPKPIKKRIKRIILPSNPEPGSTNHTPASQLGTVREFEKGEQQKDKNKDGHSGVYAQKDDSNEDENQGEDEQEVDRESHADANSHEEDTRQWEQHDGMQEKSYYDEPSDVSVGLDDPFQDTPTKVKNHLNNGKTASYSASIDTNTHGDTTCGDSFSDKATGLPGDIARGQRKPAMSEEGNNIDKTTDTMSSLSNGDMKRGDKIEAFAEVILDHSQQTPHKSKDICENITPGQMGVTSGGATDAPVKATKALNQRKAKIDKVSDDAPRIGATVNGFPPNAGGCEDINTVGITISVQTTKEGMNLTINIPGTFQQQ